MGRVSIDVAKESTLENIFKKVEEGAGIWCKPKFSEGITLGAVTALGTIVNGTDHGSSVFNLNGEIYIIYDGSNTIDKCNGLSTSWVNVTKLPYHIDLHETSIVVFDEALHFLGGRDSLTRSHFKWDGKSWSTESELPNDFCNGRAVIFNNKIHILGGGTAYYDHTCGTGRHDEHYSWNGVAWTKESTLPYPSWGITPFVQSDKLHIVGGGLVSGTTYNKRHYSWNGSSWGKETDLSFSVFNASTAKLSETQVYILGGMSNSGSGNKQSLAKIYNGSSWNDVISLPDDAYNNTAMGATIGPNKELIVIGSRLFKLASGKWTAFQATPIAIDKGDTVLYNGEVHLFYQKKHYKWLAEGWELVSTIPYNFIGGSAVVFNDKIHLVGSASSGDEDYHYSWSPDTGWKLHSNLPAKFSYGSAVVFNNELHIIGGEYLNSSTYNHYRLTGTRWDIVGHTPHDVIGSKCVVEHNGYLYAATQDSDDNKCYLNKFNGVGWVHLGYTEVTTPSDTYRYLTVYQNRLHLFTTDNTTINHVVYTGAKGNKGKEVKYAGVTISGTPSILVYGGLIFIFTKPSNNKASIFYVSYAPVDVSTLEVYIPKEHQFLCNKSEFLPIIGEVEETESGYKALTTGKYTFVNFSELFTIN